MVECNFIDYLISRRGLQGSRRNHGRRRHGSPQSSSGHLDFCTRPGRAPQAVNTSPSLFRPQTLAPPKALVLSLLTRVLSHPSRVVCVDFVAPRRRGDSPSWLVTPALLLLATPAAATQHLSSRPRTLLWTTSPSACTYKRCV